MSEMIKEFNKGDLLHINSDGKAQWGLPDGYPHKEQSETVIGEVTMDAEFAGLSFAAPFYDTDGNLFCIEEGKQYRVVFDGKEYNCVGIKRSESIHYVSVTGEIEVSQSNVFFYGTCTPTKINERNCALTTLTSDSGHTFSISEVSETIYPLDSNLFPNATTTAPGAVKQMPYLPNATGDTPTAENFNQLLRQLKNAGLMK